MPPFFSIPTQNASTNQKNFSTLLVALKYAFRLQLASTLHSFHFSSSGLAPASMPQSAADGSFWVEAAPSTHKV